MSKEKYLQKKQKKEEERLKRKGQRKFKNILFAAAGVLVLGGGVFWGGWFLSTRPSTPSAPELEIIAKQGLHWHANLSIKIFGEDQKIPANIGLGITHQPIHTHEAGGIIHMEFTGLVKEDDLRLGRFFEIWGKTFNKDCIFDKCSGSEGQLKMLVNGELTSEFENYIMRDGDKIEIIVE